MASQALVLAASNAAQPYQLTAYQEHASTFHQQPSSSSQLQPPTPQEKLSGPSEGKKRRSSPSGGLRKGLDTLTKCLERKIDQQILQAQSRAYDTSSPQPLAIANGSNKKVHWEEQSHVALGKA